MDPIEKDGNLTIVRGEINLLECLSFTSLSSISSWDGPITACLLSQSTRMSAAESSNGLLAAAAWSRGARSEWRQG